jgi:hypothetical protein
LHIKPFKSVDTIRGHSKRYTGFRNLLNQSLERVQAERGFEVPLYLAMIAPNGVMFMAIYEDIGEPQTRCRILAEHEPEDIMALPIHGLIVDAQGQGAHIVFPSASAVEFRD